jgi:acyl carrier protein
MRDNDLAATVRSSLARIAPEADLDGLDPDAPLREELDLDSMDFLNFVGELHQRTAVDVPERDYSKLASLHGCVEYLRNHAAA